jgi:hypothetical protein
MLNWIKFWIVKVVKIMSIFLRGLDLSNGSENVITKLEYDSSYGDGVLKAPNLDTQDMTIQNGLIIGSDIDGNSYNGTLEIRNSNGDVINLEYSSESTENLLISIENTKATLEDGDILVYNETNGTFKVDNISNYAGGGTGNYHVLVVDFLENEDYATTTIVPEGAQIDRLVIQSNGLTTGTNPLTFTIGGLSNIVLATQGNEFDNIATVFNLSYTQSFINIIVGTGEAGTFQSNWSGAGFGTGNGKAYLFYWTPLP